MNDIKPKKENPFATKYKATLAKRNALRKRTNNMEDKRTVKTRERLDK